MIKKVKVKDSEGMPLLHDITAIKDDGFKGVVFKRGHVIQKKDIPILENIGKEHVFAGEPDENQVHEEDAAAILTRELIGKNISSGKPSEGKISLKSEVDGIFRVNKAALDAINAVGDYTVATIYDKTSVSKKTALAGVRIVPLFTDKRIVEKAVNIARENFPVMEVLSYQEKTVGIIITGSEVYYGRIEDRFEKVLREKFSHFPAKVEGVTICPDDLEEIYRAFQKYISKNVDIIIFTGGMSVDPDDLTKAAIKNCGGKMIAFGVPIQPGNMLTVSKLEDKYLIGVPGASIHSKFTSFDIYLPRIFAEMELKKEDFLTAGVGGLLTEQNE